MLMNKEKVLEYLPHREPFLFIDSLESMELPENVKNQEVRTARDLVGTVVVCHFEVKEELDILRGHFPGNPILPGVVQVEMMAQSCAFVSLGLTGIDEDTSVKTLLLGVESAKFRKPVHPGMKLLITATIDSCRGTIAQYHCSITSNGEKISEAKILAKLDIVKKG